MTAFPKIIHDGMGFAISNWKHAWAVPRLGQFGVVSATGIETILMELALVTAGDNLGQIMKFFRQTVIPTPLLM